MREKRQRKERQRGSRGWRGKERECVGVFVEGGISNACVWLTHREFTT